MVPHVQMKELYESATGAKDKTWYPIEGGTHNEGWVTAGQAYWDLFDTFIKHPDNVAAKVTVDDEKDASDGETKEKNEDDSKIKSEL